MELSVRLSATGLLALWLTACGNLNPLPDAPPSAWAARLAQLQALERWRVNGRMAVRDADQGFSGQFSWTQTAQSYRLSVQGPLHQQGAILEGDTGSVRAQLANGTQLTAPDAETLLAQQLGITLPVAQLRAWILGIPSAHGPIVTQEFDPEGRLKLLEQAGWRVEYPAYQAVGALTLPQRLELRHEALEARLILDEWRLP